MARVLFVTDLHIPHHHPRAFDFLKRLQDKFKPTHIICAGDEVDLGSFSVKHLPNPSLHSPERELELCREGIQELAKIFPTMQVCESNHGIRIFRKAFASGLPASVLKRYAEIFEWPKGWSYHANGVEIDGVKFIHGTPFNGQTWRLAHEKLRMPVVQGHHHSRAGIVMSKTEKYTHFSVNGGCLIDPQSPAFDYAKETVEKPIISTPTVVDGVYPELHFLGGK